MRHNYTCPKHNMWHTRLILIPSITRGTNLKSKSCCNMPWNNHPVSTCQILTPNQLFVRGAIRQNLTPTLPVSRASYARIPVAGDTVAVPRSSFDPCDHLQEELQQVNTTRPCDDLGYRLYRRVCSIVGCHLQHCIDCSC